VTPAQGATEADALLRDPDRWAVFVCDSGSGLVGFIETSLRGYAEGCESSPVGFIEGWFVAPGWRASGIGRRLMAAAEEWARSRGCSEMASDTQLDNVAGQRAHSALAYAEVERLVCFRKSLLSS
jgi:aminoglycoside 6'-N-acetyltransferase I